MLVSSAQDLIADGGQVELLLNMRAYVTIGLLAKHANLVAPQIGKLLGDERGNIVCDIDAHISDYDTWLTVWKWLASTSKGTDMQVGATTYYCTTS